MDLSTPPPSGWNKIARKLGYTMAVVLGLLIIVFSVFAQRDIPIATMQLKYGNASSKYMPLMGMQVHYRSLGDSNDHNPLVFIHGTSSSLHTWDSLTTLLLKQMPHKRIISMDLPAFGLTGPSPENNYVAPYYPNFIDSFLSALHINKFILGGNSLGGSIAWQYAVAHPQKVSQLILLDAGGYPLKNEKGSLGFTLAKMPVVNKLLLYITPKSLIRKSLETVFYDQSLITEEVVTRYHEMTLSEGNRKAMLSLFTHPYKVNVEVIKTITAPTLIIWGEQDQVIAVDNAYLFKKDIANSRLLILPNVGHIPMEEAPLKTAEAILAFIKH
jgi:pimeloyl-ACP methyl ester carboxylesterase